MAVETTTETNNFLSLRVLSLAEVIPHEQTDPERVARLIQELKKDVTLKNPPIVTEWQGHYVILDGATRISALKEMGFRHVVAQLVSHNDRRLTLQAWSHIKQGVDSRDLCRLLDALPEIGLIPAELDFIQDMMVERGGLCYLILPNQEVFVIEPTPGHNRLDALNKLVTAYIGGGQVARTPHTDFATVKHEYPYLSGFFVFPTFTVEQVLQISKAGKVLPAGITRFIVPGRVLRMNIDLERLAKDEPAALKMAWLNRMLDDLLVNHRIRYYEEPVYLLDE